MKISAYLALLSVLAAASSTIVSAVSIDDTIPIARGRVTRDSAKANVDRAELRRALQAHVVYSKLDSRASIAVDDDVQERSCHAGNKHKQHAKLAKSKSKSKSKHHTHAKHKAHSATHHPSHYNTHHHHRTKHTSTSTKYAKLAKSTAHADADADEEVDCDEHGNPIETKTHTKAAKAKAAVKKVKEANKAQTTHTSSSASTKASAVSDAVSTGAGSGLFGLTFDGQCPDPNATEEFPNGSKDFLTCGISSSSPNSVWTPPHVKLNQLKVISSDAAAKASVFSACARYKSDFDAAEDATGVPAVLLMAFALQESTCQPNEMGPNGEFGMMQITKDKCGGAPNGNCLDVSFNIRTGAKYLVDTINGQCGGNALCGIGQYNGWQANKMTYNSATSTQWGCYAQNNLDYLSEVLNGYAQGKEGLDKMYSKFNNLAKCG